MAETIVWEKKRSRASCDAILASFADALRGRVDEAWVFGSFGTGDCLEDSDCDLLLVCGTDLPFWQRPQLFDIDGQCPRPRAPIGFSQSGPVV